MTPKEENTTYNGAPDLRYQIKCAIMELTDEQAEYVLWRLQCLRQEDSF